MARGARANKRGRRLENEVRDLLDEGYQQVSARYFFALRRLGQPIFAEQVHVGRDIYDKARRIDFILYHPRRWPDCLVIQCKWQSSRGTVDEKFPFEVLSIQRNEFPTIIVLAGEGYRRGAENWLRGQAGNARLLHVHSQGGLYRFHSQGRL